MLNTSHKTVLLPDWIPLPPLPSEPEDEEVVGDSQDSPHKAKLRNPSGPKTRDPYEMDDSSAMLPIFVAIGEFSLVERVRTVVNQLIVVAGAFIPLVFCLCRL
jgi:hypothetical protein